MDYVENQTQMQFGVRYDVILSYYLDPCYNTFERGVGHEHQI